MNKQSKFHRLSGRGVNQGKVNKNALEKLDFDTFRRFKLFNLATKREILRSVGEALDRIKPSIVMPTPDNPLGRIGLAEIRPDVWIWVCVEDPVNPLAFTGKKFRYVDSFLLTDSVATYQVNRQQQIILLRNKGGLRITLNVFGIPGYMRKSPV